MIDHVWSILCSNTVTDKESNNISLHNVVESLEIFAAPQESQLLPIHLEFVTLWIRRDPEVSVKGNSRVSLVSPSGKTVTSNELAIDLSKAERTRNRFIYDSLPMEESGRHHFVVELQVDGDWQQVASIPLAVKFSQSDTDEASTLRK